MIAFVPGNRVTLLENGNAYFPALLAAIQTAHREVYLETYIFEDDDTGRMIAGALMAAARRGVAVHVLVDGFDARDFPNRMMPALEAAGAQVLVFRPEIARFSFRRHRLRRMHRKLAVIDGRIAFAGGINIIDDTHIPPPAPPRYDYAVSVEGPLLAPIHAASRKLWERVAWAHLRHRLTTADALLPVVAPCGETYAGFLIRDNVRHRRDIEDAYLEAIATARREIVIANAYFFPGLRFRHALMEAARRGVTVTVLLQGRVEYALLHYASQALYGVLLQGGVRIFEYHRSFLHAKVAVIDNCWATVGSSNIDPFSLLLAREANVVVRDANFAAQLRGRLSSAMEEGAKELRNDDWRHKPWYARLRHWLAYSLVRLMIGVAGYAGQH